MKTDPHQCRRCGGALPVGVKLAFYTDTESDAICLGDFCSVDHAFEALDEVSSTLPEALYLGVRVERGEHDQAALARAMSDLAYRAMQAEAEERVEADPKGLS